MSDLSICMIVKNEAKNLPRILGSLDGLWDQLVVVDTGSSDNTIEVAKEFGAEIYEHEWQKDFSEARNFSLEKARCEWIGVFDGDEELEVTDIPLIREYLAKPGADRLLIQNLNQRRDSWSMHPMERFFRRGKGHYVGRKHNQLIAEGNVVYLPVRLYHYGYNLPPDQMRAKHERDLELLSIQHDEDPQNTFVYRNMIRLLRSMGDYEAVLNWAASLNQGLEAGTLTISDGSLHMVSIDAANAHYQLFEIDRAIETLKALLSRFPESIDGHYDVAEIFFVQEDYENALEHYEQYLSLLHKAKNELVLYEIIDSWGMEYKAYNNMALSYGYIGDLTRSQQCFKVACLGIVESTLDSYFRVSKNLGRGNQKARNLRILDLKESKGAPENESIQQTN